MSPQFVSGGKVIDEATYNALVAKRRIRPASQDLSLMDKAVNLVGAAERTLKATARGQAILVSSEERDRRLAVCRDCEFFTGITCTKCGCHIRFKAKLQTEHCPIGKW